MCGIWLLLTRDPTLDLSNAKLFESFMKIKARGPDNSYYKIHNQHKLIVGFHRLAINGLAKVSADQPFVQESDTSIFYMIANGEVYNYKELAKKYEIELTSGSDCEILLPLFQKIGLDAMIKELDPECAMIICEIDKATQQVKLHVSRDHCGIRPLFISWSQDTILLSSEMKGIPFLGDDNFEIQQFPPRYHLTISSTDTFTNLPYVEYINFANIQPAIFDFEEAKQRIKEEFIKAVESRMMTDAPIGALLSGGLDSGLDSAEASIIKQSEGEKLKTFCIGQVLDSPDVVHAEIASIHINSDHQTIIVSEEDCLKAIDNIIYIIESFDITSVRASTMQYLISNWVAKNTDVKVIILGDGSDELTGGYLYMLKAPSHTEFHNEILKLLNNIHYFDVLRSDRGIASNGLECRVPFLRRKFIEMYLSIDVSLRMPINGVEKSLLRESFRGTGLLPDQILFRKKEAFSDGCSTIERSWYTILQENTNKMYTDEEFESEKIKYIHCPPPTKEALLYRKIFEKHFGSCEKVAKVIPYYWMPNNQWCNATDPSARTLENYGV
jgi:asparagine synthase (glutamine-hydrolysing)